MTTTQTMRSKFTLVVWLSCIGESTDDIFGTFIANLDIVGS